jgi:hypothetical protein
VLGPCDGEPAFLDFLSMPGIRSFASQAGLDTSSVEELAIATSEVGDCRPRESD